MICVNLFIVYLTILWNTQFWRKKRKKERVECFMPSFPYKEATEFSQSMIKEGLIVIPILRQYWYPEKINSIESRWKILKFKAKYIDMFINESL